MNSERDASYLSFSSTPVTWSSSPSFLDRGDLKDKYYDKGATILTKAAAL